MIVEAHLPGIASGIMSLPNVQHEATTSNTHTIVACLADKSKNTTARHIGMRARHTCVAGTNARGPCRLWYARPEKITKHNTKRNDTRLFLGLVMNQLLPPCPHTPTRHRTVACAQRGIIVQCPAVSRSCSCTKTTPDLTFLWINVVERKRPLCKEHKDKHKWEMVRTTSGPRIRHFRNIFPESS